MPDSAEMPESAEMPNSAEMADGGRAHGLNDDGG